MWVLPNILILLGKLGRRFITMIEKNKNIGKLSLIARPGCGKFILHKQTFTQTRSLACLSYTKSLPISKANLPPPEKAMNAAAGSSTRFWRSWCRLLHRKPLTYFDVLKRFLELPASVKNASTPSWPHPSFPGNGFGKGFGR